MNRRNVSIPGAYFASSSPPQQVACYKPDDECTDTNKGHWSDNLFSINTSEVDRDYLSGIIDKNYNVDYTSPHEPPLELPCHIGTKVRVRDQSQGSHH